MSILMWKDTKKENLRNLFCLTVSISAIDIIICLCSQSQLKVVVILRLLHAKTWIIALYHAVLCTIKEHISKHACL